MARIPATSKPPLPPRYLSRLAGILGLFALLGASTACDRYFGVDQSRVPPHCMLRTCAEADKNCGAIDDGCGGQLQCGNCFGFEICGGGSVDNICACTPACAGRCGGSDGCGGQCPDSCIEPQTCGGGRFPNVCGCLPDCFGKCGGDDECGGQCPPTCLAPRTCGGGELVNECGCTPNCEGLCGGFDGCFDDCPDTCSGAETCGGADEVNVCGCPTDCDDKCGGDDGCGGQCADECVLPFTCGTGGQPNICGCVAKTCAVQLLQSGTDCGLLHDGCGKPIQCIGSCAGATVCNELVGDCCTPVCSAGQCGTDGCGGVCGTCGAGQSCGLAAAQTCSAGGAGLCSADGWCPLSPQPQGNTLNGVAVIERDSAILVGDESTILSWQAATGLTREAVVGRSGQDLHGVFALSPSNAVAVGNRGTVVRLNGGTWTESNVGLAALYGVWGVDDANIWLVGQGGTIMRPLPGDTSRWTTDEKSTDSDLRAVYGFSAADVWAVGRGGTILHRAGTSWADVSPQLTTKTLYGIWGVSADDLWAVGGDADSGSVILHRSASGWVEVKPTAYNSILLNTGLNGIAGYDASSIWAVGAAGETLRWDGLTWRSDYEGLGAWRGVGSTTGGTIRAWAVGEAGEMKRFDGAGWSAVDAAAAADNVAALPNATSHDIIALDAVSPTSVWALDSSARLIHYNAGVVTRSAIPVFADEIERQPVAVAAVDDANVWIVLAAAADPKTKGAIVHFNGAVFKIVREQGTDPGFSGVWPGSPTDIWVVGAGGTMLRGDLGPQGFNRFVSGTMKDLTAVHGAAVDAVFVTGENFLRGWDGTAWKEVSAFGQLLTAVHVVSKSNVWAVGTTGSIFYDGMEAKHRVIPALTGLLDIVVSDAGAVWAVGRVNSASEHPLLMEWQATTWVRRDSGCSGSMHALAAAGPAVFAGGRCGIVWWQP